MEVRFLWQNCTIQELDKFFWFMRECLRDVFDSKNFVFILNIHSDNAHLLHGLNFEEAGFTRLSPRVFNPNKPRFGLAPGSGDSCWVYGQPIPREGMHGNYI